MFYSDNVLLLSLLQLVENLRQLLIRLHLPNDPFLFRLALSACQHGTILNCVTERTSQWSHFKQPAEQRSGRTRFEPGCLTHATVLTEDFDEIKGVEAQQQDQLVLTLSVITRRLQFKRTQEVNGSGNENVAMQDNIFKKEAA